LPMKHYEPILFLCAWGKFALQPFLGQAPRKLSSRADGR